MEVKTYRARSLAEAMQRISRDLGPEASVLHVRPISATIWNWWRGHRWEVVGGHDPEIPSRFQQFLNEEPNRLADFEYSDVEFRPEEFFKPTSQQSRAVFPSPENRRTSSSVVQEPTIRENLLQLQADVEAVDELLGDFADLAQSLADQSAWSKWVQQFSEQIEFPGELQRQNCCTRVALVGPTGVGKTTSIAKLAADFHLRHGLRVGLITVDTFRVGAVDQLQAYANILDLPFLVVRTPDEMRAALQAWANLDLVLIDTIGRNPRDVQGIESMEAVLQAAQLDHLLLTISASNSSQTLQAAVACYRHLGSATETSLILTKVDECQTLASLYPLLKQWQIPWRYWTNGQEVPDDLGVARPDVLAWFLDEIELVARPLNTPLEAAST